MYLEALDLSGNNIYGKLPPKFNNFSSLKVLNIENNNLEGKILVELVKLNKI